MTFPNNGAGGSADGSVVPAFDQARVAVAGTRGIVARFPGVVAVFATGAETDEQQLEQFLAICEQASAEGARAPGRRLARRLSVWLGGLEEPPCLGTVAATEDSIAVFLSGPAELRLGGPQPSLSGADSAAWLDRVIDWPAGGFTLAVSDEQTARSAVLNLALGVVIGGSASMAAATPGGGDAGYPVVAAQDVSERPADSQPLLSALGEGPSSGLTGPMPLMPLEHEMEPGAEPVPVADELPVPVVPPSGEDPKPALRPPARSSLIAGADSPEPPREPLPIPGAPEPAEMPKAAGLDPTVPQVQGFLCSRGHLNDPRALFCGLCGIRMAERTGILTIGRRPPLGLLVFDDGSTFTVDSGYLLGRDPESDDRVKQGSLRPLVVLDSRGAVSRRHALIQLDGWSVLVGDAGSANGTFIAERGSTAWSALVPERLVALQAGTRIRIGTRTFVFESPNGGP